MAIRTSKSDRNWCSIAQNQIVYKAGTPFVYAGEMPEDGRIEPPVSTEWDSALKVTASNGWRLVDLRVSQCLENVVDCNNKVLACSFVGEFGWLGQQRGDQVITVKGGCYNLAFSGVIFSRGRNADVVVGAWSDQCFDVSTNLDFSGLKRDDSSPVTFILARHKSVKLPPGARVLFWKSVGYRIAWWVKWCAVKAGLFGKGQS